MYSMVASAETKMVLCHDAKEPESRTDELGFNSYQLVCLFVLLLLLLCVCVCSVCVCVCLTVIYFTLCFSGKTLLSAILCFKSSWVFLSSDVKAPHRTFTDNGSLY